MQTASDISYDRAKAAILGGAIGDALGMPTQTLTRNEITSHYGKITDFVAPFDNHPVSHGLTAGAVTDDTEQALLLAHRIIESPEHFDQRAWAKDLLDWEANVKLRGLHDLLGPSTKQALENLLSGTPPDQTGRNGTTNGATMRITPVGIATPVEPLSEFLNQIETTCRVTHNTREAISAAAAVGAVISAGIEGASFQDALSIAIKAASEGAKKGANAGVDDIPRRIEHVVRLASSRITADQLATQIGTSVASHESVITAFGLVVLADYAPWPAALMSAVIGDDTDTIAAIATSMAAACKGLDALPPQAVQKVEVTNALDVECVATGLLAVRERRTASVTSTLGAPV